MPMISNPVLPKFGRVVKSAWIEVQQLAVAQVSTWRQLGCLLTWYSQKGKTHYTFWAHLQELYHPNYKGTKAWSWLFLWWCPSTAWHACLQMLRTALQYAPFSVSISQSMCSWCRQVVWGPNTHCTTRHTPLVNRSTVKLLELLPQMTFMCLHWSGPCLVSNNNPTSWVCQLNSVLLCWSGLWVKVRPWIEVLFVSWATAVLHDKFASKFHVFVSEWSCQVSKSTASC